MYYRYHKSDQSDDFIKSVYETFDKSIIEAFIKNANNFSRDEIDELTHLITYISAYGVYHHRVSNQPRHFIYTHLERDFSNYDKLIRESIDETGDEVKNYTPLRRHENIYRFFFQNAFLHTRDRSSSSRSIH